MLFNFYMNKTSKIILHFYYAICKYNWKNLMTFEISFLKYPLQSNHGPIILHNCCISERQHWVCYVSWKHGIVVTVGQKTRPVDRKFGILHTTVMCRSLCSVIVRCINLTENLLTSRVSATVTVIYDNDNVNRK